MTARDTSIAAFAAIKPRLSERQAAVYALLQRSHALTNKEIARELGWEINTVTPRTNELVDYGLVRHFGKRPCRITGKLAYAWGIRTDRPVEGPKPALVPVSVLREDGTRVVRFVEKAN